MIKQFVLPNQMPIKVEQFTGYAPFTTPVELRRDFTRDLTGALSRRFVLNTVEGEQTIRDRDYIVIRRDGYEILKREEVYMYKELK